MEAVSFTSAYRQLKPVEKAFVDAYVQQIERETQRNGERISLALHKAIPPETVDASRGLLDKPLVRAAIAERINDIAAATELTVQRVVKELMSVAFASVGDYMTISEGSGQPFFNLASCTPEQLSAIQSIEIEENPRGGRKFKFKLHDKLTGIDKLARFMGMLDPDNPYWRAETAKNITQQTALPDDITPDKAADLYARMIAD